MVKLTISPGGSECVRNLSLVSHESVVTNGINCFDQLTSLLLGSKLASLVVGIEEEMFIAKVIN